LSIKANNWLAGTTLKGCDGNQEEKIWEGGWMVVATSSIESKGIGEQAEQRSRLNIPADMLQ
jgi:hypothetical protein